MHNHHPAHCCTSMIGSCWDSKVGMWCNKRNTRAKSHSPKISFQFWPKARRPLAEVLRDLHLLPNGKFPKSSSSSARNNLPSPSSSAMINGPICVALGRTESLQQELQRRAWVVYTSKIAWHPLVFVLSASRVGHEFMCWEVQRGAPEIIAGGMRRTEARISTATKEPSPFFITQG